MVDIVGRELKIHAVEAFSGAALIAIKAFHPAMEVRVLAPVVEFRRIANG
ncbi:hypothetical protein [Rhizobium giardinii]|uniref:Uncharacterized protein n=1 Tax=Rhizobium giardinii TaxID=56731 RepID=A0A7W8X9Q4_9HYPH|nr:hypothetical protein [Rhizobium giardinii]MBB5535848.1 hypothetical protein [Rhizobium giardinii]